MAIIHMPDGTELPVQGTPLPEMCLKMVDPKASRKMGRPMLRLQRFTIWRRVTSASSDYWWAEPAPDSQPQKTKGPGLP